MLPDFSPLFQSLLGSLFTWFLTALGSAFCLLHHTRISNNILLDGSLGFSAGVMIAACFWSLLDPAIERTVESFSDEWKHFAFIPSAIGILAGAAFVYLADKHFPMADYVNIPGDSNFNSNSVSYSKKFDYEHETEVHVVLDTEKETYLRRKTNQLSQNQPSSHPSSDIHLTKRSINKIALMILAITVHNIPEGLAVGVGFGAVGSSTKATFENARNLAIGIGIQNFPEGLAVSLPLKAAGCSTWWSIWYGQLSGIVEPVAALFGCGLVQLIEPLLPYALAFAAGAMIFVVFDSIVPESNERGNGRVSSLMVIVGFVVMMCLDVGLG